MEQQNLFTLLRETLTVSEYANLAATLGMSAIKLGRVEAGSSDFSFDEMTILLRLMRQKGIYNEKSITEFIKRYNVGNSLTYKEMTKLNKL